MHALLRDVATELAEYMATLDLASLDAATRRRRYRELATVEVLHTLVIAATPATMNARRSFTRRSNVST